MALQMISKKESLSDSAYQMIRLAIIRNELEAGEVLAEEKLAEMLGISRTPVRTALQMLVADQLAETDPRGRIIVSEVVDQDVKNVDQVRAEIEPISVRLNCARGLTAEQANELRSYCKAQKKAASESNTEDFFISGYSFHNQLAIYSGNAFLADMIERASLTAVRYLMKRPHPEQYIDASGTEHEEILDLIVAGEADKAMVKMRSHILDAKPSFLK